MHGPQDLLDFAGDGPVVVKPANRQASMRVQLLDRVDRATAEQAWAHTAGASEYEQVPDRELAWRFVAEERLVGPEYSVEVLVRAGAEVHLGVSPTRAGYSG